MCALGGANSGQHAYVACTLPTEPSFQPGDSYLKINNLTWKLKVRQTASEMDQVFWLFNIFRMPGIWTAVNQMYFSVALWSLVIKLNPLSVFLFLWQPSSYSIETAPRRPLWTCHGILIAPTSPKPPVKIKTGIRCWLELKMFILPSVENPAFLTWVDALWAAGPTQQKLLFLFV